MNAHDFIAQVAQKTGQSQVKTKELVDAVLSTIKEAVKADETVKFLGFGQFKRTIRAARRCSNPRTGEMIDIPQREAAVFKISPGFLD